MLLPHPESDISQNIMVMASDILLLLKKKKAIFIDSLLSMFLEQDHRRDANIFIECLIFLYIIDAVEHQPNSLKIKIKENKYVDMPLFGN